MKVAYNDFALPIVRDEIPVAWRSEERGPFTHSGRVRQGDLFPLSEAFKTGFVATFDDRWPRSEPATPTADHPGRWQRQQTR